MKKYSVLIADDEQHARDYLRKLVEEHSDLDLKGVCESGKAVLSFCKTMVPDILLLDIQMPGLNGIETARRLLQHEHRPVIVFTTAYDQYALAAFEVEALDYLLKPFSSKHFTKAMVRARAQVDSQQKHQFEAQMQRLFDRFRETKSTTLDHFDIKDKGLIHTVHSRDILYITADSEYVRLHTARQYHLLRAALDVLVQQLPPSFLRIHRSHILNYDHLQHWKYLNNGTYRFTLTNGDELASSRKYQTAIREVLTSP